MLAETQIEQRAITSVFFFTNTIPLGSEPNLYFDEMTHKRNEDEVHNKARSERPGNSEPQGVGRQSREAGSSVRAGRRVRRYSAE